jgi:hypothetical protein
MSIATMILGESGTGKSTSLRNLDPARTLLIQAVRKPLPFRSANWKPYTKTTGTGSIIQTDNPALIEAAMRKIQREIVIVDDFQYVLANEFMRRSDEKGFEKFTEIGRHAWNVLMAAAGLDDDRRVYILAHTASDDFGRTKMKTIGKLLDEKITPEGLVTIVLRTMARDGQYHFRTQNDGTDTTKSPMGMFAEQLIPNDLAAVDTAICDYYGIGVAA